MKTTMLVFAALIAIGLLPSSAPAAQRGGNTRDADGDGVLCVIPPL